MILPNLEQSLKVELRKIYAIIYSSNITIFDFMTVCYFQIHGIVTLPLLTIHIIGPTYTGPHQLKST